MATKQQRYRDRRLAEGWERVELLVPAVAVPWLKAYAHAARSRFELGIEPPRFDGMGVNATPGASIVAEAVPVQGQRHPSQSAGPNPARSEPPQPHGPDDRPAPSDKTSALFKRIEDHQRSQADADVARPDFSKGLLR